MTDSLKEVNVTIDTHSVVLDIPLHPIFILPLSDTGMMPDAIDGRADVRERRLYQPRHLPPRNRTESQLLSVWINTHQAMFMTIAMSSYAVTQAIRTIARRELSATLSWLGFAREARYAAAAYTDLGALTQPLYEAYVRESMKLVHPGFSGVSNLESIKMELCLRELKEALLTCMHSDREFVMSIDQACEEVSQADHFWWRSHGQAMRRMVRTPVSLARTDAKEKAKEAGGPVDFEAYRNKVLRDPKAQKEYDAYFSVERRPGLTLRSWQCHLTRALATADDYISQQGEIAERSLHARPHLFAMMTRVAGSEGGESTRTGSEGIPARPTLCHLTRRCPSFAERISR
jgi:hypothetical protein